MEELIYFCVRIVCIGYLLYSVYGWRRRIETVCTLLYGKPCVKKENKEAAGTESAVSDAEVMEVPVMSIWTRMPERLPFPS